MKIRMKKIKSVVFFGLMVFLSACASVPNIEPVSMEVDTSNTSTDPTYGYSEDNPILLGGFLLETKYRGIHREYFANLVGPKWQEVKAVRLGSCCGFVDESLPFGTGLLDMYELSYEGQKKPVVVYVNLYKYESPKAPLGFGL